MRLPTSNEQVLRLIWDDAITRRLNKIMTYAYMRYDDSDFMSKYWIVRQFWCFVGNRSDDLDRLWRRRPIR